MAGNLLPIIVLGAGAAILLSKKKKDESLKGGTCASLGPSVHHDRAKEGMVCDYQTGEWVKVPMAGFSKQERKIPGYEFYPETASWKIEYRGEKPGDFAPWKWTATITEGHFSEGTEESYDDARQNISRYLGQAGYKA